jgi:putative DNA primase/helicase
LSDEEKTKVRLKDPDIMSKLTTSEEMSGLLNEALLGLDRLLNQKDFSSTLSSRQLEELWQRKSNSIVSFIKEYVIEDETTEVTKDDFRKVYYKYCRQYGLPVASDKEIKHELNQQIDSYDTFQPHGGRKTAVWTGFRLRPEQSEDRIQGNLTSITKKQFV